MMADPIVLDFHNSLLRKSDLRLLEYPNWLNDNLINFAYEYFEYNLFEEHADKVAFIGPATVQFIKLGSEADMLGMIECLGLAQKQLIFFAINNSSEASDSGTHWSTLVFNKSAGCFEHYDSLKSNEAPAKSVALDLHSHLRADRSFRSMPTPQQANSCDCGMYVICLTEHIADCILNRKKPAFESITPSFVRAARNKWKEKVIQLGKGEEK